MEEKRIRTTAHRRFHLPAKRKDITKIPRNKSTVDSAERRSPADYCLRVRPPIEPGSFLYLLLRKAYSSSDSRNRLPAGRGIPFIVSSLRSHCGQWGTGTVHSLPASMKNVGRCISGSEEAAASQTDRRAAHLSVGIAPLSRNEMYSPWRANSSMTPDAFEKECARSRGPVKT